MRFTMTSLLALSVAALSAATAAPQRIRKADLLEHITQAYGGHKAEACRSIVLEMEVELVHPFGNRVRGKIAARPNMFLLQYDVAPLRYRTGLNDGKGWVVDGNDPNKVNPVEGPASNVLQLYSLVYSPYLISYLKTNAGRVVELGRKPYRGSDCYLLRFKLDNVGPVDLLFDATAHLLKGVRFIYPSDPPTPFEIAFGSYAMHEGVNVPRRISIYRRGESYRNYNILQVEACGDISPAVFAPSR